MAGLESPEHYIWFARGLALLHAVVVAITVAGGVAIFTGRFREARLDDLFAWAFVACCVGQLISLVLTGGCILTAWQRELLLRGGEADPFSGTFLQRYLPWLPSWFAVSGVPLLTLGALVGAGVQVVGSIRQRRRGEKP
jgi:hypothetical protein